MRPSFAVGRISEDGTAVLSGITPFEFPMENAW
jgi:hypothetical protein